MKDVTDWESSQNKELSEGARSKELLIHKTDSQKIGQDVLYLYKLSTQNTGAENKEESSFKFHADFWMELIAYQVGIFFGFNIPKTFVAKKEYFENGKKILTYGSLQEWFITEKNQKIPHKQFLYGQEFLCEGSDSYPKERTKSQKNKYYNLDFITRCFYDVAGKSSIEYVSPEKFLSELFLMFCFDSIIGNADRHDRNWGFLWSFENNQYEFAPLFDNGSSLSRDIKEVGPNKSIEKYRNNEIPLKDLIKGKKSAHVMLFDMYNQKLNYYEFVEKFIKGYFIEKKNITKNVKNIIINILDKNIEDLFKGIQPLDNIEKFSLTTNRIKFVCEILRQRITLLKEIFVKNKNNLLK